MDVIVMASDYTEEEHTQLVRSAERALKAVDDFTDGQAGRLFKDLRVEISEEYAEGGGKAKSEENKIVLNGRKMLLSLAQMRGVSGAYAEDELAGSSIAENNPGGALEYTLVHEMGHILDELTEAGNKWHRISSKHSPTKYGRKPDKWNTEKDHEAFAEGFAHMVYGMPVSNTLAKAVRRTIKAKLAENPLGGNSGQF